MVGRTPWSAADAPVGLCPHRARCRTCSSDSGTGASRADRGVRPTKDIPMAGIRGRKKGNYPAAAPVALRLRKHSRQ
jgi:hypothetical protein